MRVRARIHLRIEGVKQKGAAVIFYRAPDQLKIDIHDTLLNIGIMSAKSDRDSIRIYLPRDNRFIEGNIEETLFAVTGVNLSPFDPFSAIMGFPNLSPADLPRVTEFTRHTDSLFVKIMAPLWTRHMWFDAKSATLLKEQIYAPGGTLVTQRTMSDYEHVDGVILPRKIEIFQSDGRIEIRVIERRINTPFPDERFEMKMPNNVVPLGLDG